MPLPRSPVRPLSNFSFPFWVEAPCLSRGPLRKSQAPGYTPVGPSGTDLMKGVCGREGAGRVGMLIQDKSLCLSFPICEVGVSSVVLEHTGSQELGME